MIRSRGPAAHFLFGGWHGSATLGAESQCYDAGLASIRQSPIRERLLESAPLAGIRGIGGITTFGLREACGIRQFEYLPN